MTLIEMLVVIAIIGMLTALITTAAIYARRHAASVTCQNNLHQIGTTLHSLAQDHAGLYADLADAYPSKNVPNDSGFPWWARVYQQLEPDAQGGMGMIYAKDPATGAYLTGPGDVLNPSGHVLTGQLPPTLRNVFHCAMAGALDTSNAANLFNSISYGMVFDVKDAAGYQYRANPTSTLPTPSPGFLASPKNLTLADKMPDPFYISEIKNPGAFILVSEAYTGEPIPNPPPSWTGGRISMGDPTGNGTGYQRGAGDLPPYNAPIVGRHDGSANVLYGDLSVHAEQAAAGGTMTNINANTPLWTLPGD